MTFTFQRPPHGSRPPRRYALSPPPCRGRRAPLRRRLRSSRRTTELDAGAPCLREPDRDRLLRRSRAVLSFANVMHLLPHELPSLRRRRLSLPFILARAAQRFFLRHRSSLLADDS